MAMGGRVVVVWWSWCGGVVVWWWCGTRVCDHDEREDVENTLFGDRIWHLILGFPKFESSVFVGQIWLEISLKFQSN